MRKRIPLLYTIYTNGFYGTEKMSLATASGLREDFDPIIVTPPGAAAKAAREMGLEVVQTTSAVATAGIKTVNVPGYAATLKPFFSRHEQIAFVSTHHGHSLVFAAMNAFYRRNVAHLHVLHGPPLVGFGVRSLMNALPMKTVAISQFTRGCLLASGVRDQKISLIENFLSSERVSNAPQRPKFLQNGIRRVAIISRLVPAKRVDLLLSCLEQRPSLNAIEFRVYGTGILNDGYSDMLRERSAAGGLNITFEGYRTDIPEQLAASDLFVHLNSSEPFGLVVLEAMASGVPVLVPNQGGSAAIVSPGLTGLQFTADDPTSLADVLEQYAAISPERLNSFVDRSRDELASRFSATNRIEDYARLIKEQLALSKP